MANADIPILKTDPYYFSLVYPVPVPQQKKELENDLIQNGCHYPIIVSQGTMIDGHKRYAICQQCHVGYTRA